MAKFSIATWNVNSIKVRLEHVLEWLKTNEPDVLALQELKLPTENFPHEAFEEVGYRAVVSGQKTYNGVAVLSREKIDNNDVVTDLPGMDDPQRRVLGVTVKGVRILDLYVPNGQSVGSEKYEYKLQWFQQLQKLVKKELRQYEKFVTLGDFNIAPADIDVHDPEEWQGSVLCSDQEREALTKLCDLGLADCYRQLHPDTQQFSWWDYRMNAYKRKRGLRIDHILASEALASNCEVCNVDEEPRKWERPSDHAPVVAVFDV